MNNRNGTKNNSSMFGSGFSLRRFLLETAPTFIENGSRTRNFDPERGPIGTKRDKKYGSGEGSSKVHKKNSWDYSKQPLTSSSTKLKPPNDLTSDTLSSPSSSSSTASGSSDEAKDQWLVENNYCPICYHVPIFPNSFYILFTCKHSSCQNCLQRYLKNEINESRTDIACPQCSEAMHPSDIELLLKENTEVINKYEDFMVRRFLLSDPDSRWCPAPDCSYAVIASGCASCPRIRCQRPGCGLLFCYHCKAEWHPDQTCDAARASRHNQIRNPSTHLNQEPKQRGDEIKPCPRCQVLIVKMDDGSCNHMVCSICTAEFCWLCMKEISDLHYLSPSGCTFWGKKPWSRKKKLMWQLGTLVGAPVGIALVAGIAVPAMIIGIPVWVGKKIHAKYFAETKIKRNSAVLSSVLGSLLVSPVLAGLAVAVGVPILLFYVYGVVPISLCRASCDLSTSREGLKFEFYDDEDIDGSEVTHGNDRSSYRIQTDGTSFDAVSRSIGDVSLSVGSGSHIGVTSASNNASYIICNSKFDNESTIGLAGSIASGPRFEIQADLTSVGSVSGITCNSEKSGGSISNNASTKALAGSIY